MASTTAIGFGAIENVTEISSIRINLPKCDYLCSSYKIRSCKANACLRPAIDVGYKHGRDISQQFDGRSVRTRAVEF